MNGDPMVKGEFLLEKFPGKGGWTYAALPGISPDKNSWFGWIKVRGTIDNYEFRQFHLMPMGNGMLFLSVNARVRKAIRKSEGDKVFITIYRETEASDMSEEFEACQSDEPRAKACFENLSVPERKKYTDWINAGKTVDEKTERMAETINRLVDMKKYYP